MKKIFYFIASAIVALGAVACQNDINENIDNNQQTEGLSIKVTIAEQTRVALGELNTENKMRKLTFTENDQLIASAEGKSVIFTYTKAEGDVYTFTCKDGKVSELIGTKPNFKYWADGLDEATLATNVAVCNTAAEDIAGIGMYATGDDGDQPNGNLGDEGYTVTLHALPLLKFNANEPVKFESDFPSLFFVDGWESSYITTKTGDIYLPIMSSGGIKCEVTVTTESGFNKTFKKVLDENTIYNLGAIAVPNVLYLNPGLWNVDGAWFAAYFFNSEPAAVAAMTRTEAEGTKWVKMTDEDVDGIYECEAPAGYNSVIFTRMNPEYTECAWDVTEGEGESFKVLEDRVWNQTADLEIGVAPNNYCYIIGWNECTWQTADYEIPVPAKFYVVNNGNWSSLNLYAWDADDKHFLGDWPGTAMTQEGTSNKYYVEIPADYVGKTFNYIVNGGGNQTGDLTVENFTDGYTYEIPGVADPKPETVTLYLKTDWGWTDWALYAWGGSGTWGDFNKWPGKAMEDTATIGGVTYKAWDIPASCVGQSGIQVIVTGKENGGTKQTKDTPVTFTSGKDVFVEITGWDSSVNKANLTVLTSPY